MEWIQGLAPAGLLVWVIILLLPWRPWSTRESLDTGKNYTDTDLSGITVLIPARNEAPVIAQTLQALARQSRQLPIIVVDDQSTDDTARIVENLSLPNLVLVHGEPTPPGWSGKLWALEQARTRAKTDLLLLLDADIELAPGLVDTLKKKLLETNTHLISLMARLRMNSVWELLLIPAFIYFFKLLYPFALSNRNSRYVAAAAGGCILLRARSLNAIGGFAALKDAIIDDCTLARCFRKHGYSTWIGLTHTAVSLRAYHDLAGIWHMVTRTAFTQLRFSLLLLALCTVIMFVAFLAPVLNTVMSQGWPRWLGLATLPVMFATYAPLLRYYGIPIVWSLSLPVAGTLYLVMTWHSALNHLSGRGAVWKGRSYGKNPAV